MILTQTGNLVRIEASRHWKLPSLKEIWDYRQLLYYFTWRDLKVRYKQTLLGAAWAILQPLLTMLIFTIFLGRLARLPSNGIPYPLFFYSALIIWSAFATMLVQTSKCLITHSGLIQKNYFPLILLPTSCILSSIVDFLISSTLLLGLLAYYQIPLSGNLVLIPFFLGVGVVTAVGAGLLFSSLNATFRDVNYLIPSIVQVWFFTSPILFPASMVPESWRLLYAINPMVGVVEGFRWALFGARYDITGVVLVSSIAAFLFLVCGGLIFCRVERFLVEKL